MRDRGENAEEERAVLNLLDFTAVGKKREVTGKWDHLIEGRGLIAKIL